MSAQRRKDTDAELRIRRLLHAAGLRYRLGVKVPGMARRTIDIAFPRRHIAVFIDGCYWHRCPAHHIPAKNNSQWWADKLEGNVRRDRETSAYLESVGWTVLRYWEHEDPMAVRDSIAEVVRTAAARNSDD